MDGLGGIGNQGSMPQAAASFVPGEARPAEVSVQRVNEAKKDESVLNQKAPSDQERFELVRRAAQQYVANFYAVSDTRFTTYRRGVGESSFFETRFTSLETGEVTIVPQARLFEGVDFDGGSLVKANV